MEYRFVELFFVFIDFDEANSLVLVPLPPTEPPPIATYLVILHSFIYSGVSYNERS
jgi:hypothetical protein